MKALNYIFFGIYNSYYKDGNFTNNIPWLKAISVLGVSLSCNIISVSFLFSDGDRIHLERSTLIIFAAISFVFLYFMFFRNRRYEDIYKEFCHLNKQQRLVNKFISWLYILLSFIICLLPPLLFSI